MKYHEYYGDIIWTRHAIEKMRDRGLSQAIAWETFKYPDNKITGKKPHTTEFQKKIDFQRITVIVTQNEKNEWVVISAWIDPPFPGSKDYRNNQEYRRYQKAGGFMKFLLLIKRQLGL